MNHTLQVIPTEYKGIKFRSRTEARWAVFYDALGVNWEYEKEGYQLESGWYLPDFWMPDLKCWIEIKGQRPDEKEIKLLYELCTATNNEGYIFFGGLPRIKYTKGRKLVYQPYSIDSTGSAIWVPVEYKNLGTFSVINNTPRAYGYQWCECDTCNKEYGQKYAIHHCNNEMLSEDLKNAYDTAIRENFRVDKVEMQPTFMTYPPRSIEVITEAKKKLYHWLVETEEREKDFCSFGPLSWRTNYGVFLDLPFHETDDEYYWESSKGLIKVGDEASITGFAAKMEFDPNFDRGKLLFKPHITIFHKGVALILIWIDEMCEDLNEIYQFYHYSKPEIYVAQSCIINPLNNNPLNIAMDKIF